jgi:hypothetical protein
LQAALEQAALEQAALEQAALGQAALGQAALGQAALVPQGNWPAALWPMNGVHPKENTKSGQGGPCLTDAAQEAALDEPLVFVAATLRSERIPQR